MGRKRHDPAAAAAKRVKARALHGNSSGELRRQVREAAEKGHLDTLCNASGLKGTALTRMFNGSKPIQEPYRSLLITALKNLEDGQSGMG